MKIPMPSPRGTNHARLFMETIPTAAYDAALGEADAAALLDFLRDKLSPEDVSEFCRLAGLDPNAGAMDEDDDDLPKNGVERAMDQRLGRRPRSSDAEFFSRFPGAKNIGIIP